MNRKIVVLTGAGISAESGIQTFRSTFGGTNGLWNNHRMEDVCTPEALLKNPKLVWDFYHERKLNCETKQPNAAHLALAELETEYPDDVVIITQNVDDLHERAGSKNVLHIHGQLNKCRTLREGTIVDWDDTCKFTSHRPHIVFFEEIPFHADECLAALLNAKEYVMIGSSNQVYPAARFINIVPTDCHKVLLNYESVIQEQKFDTRLYGKATEVVPAYINELINLLRK